MMVWQGAISLVEMDCMLDFAHIVMALIYEVAVRFLLPTVESVPQM